MNTLIAFLMSLFIVLIAVLLLGIRVFFTKKGKFPNIHIGGNKRLKKDGIACVTTQDAEAYKKPSNDINKVIKEINEK